MGFSLQSGAMKGGLLKGDDTLDTYNPALISHCDCFVSLHRSEGFGLPLAEAMAYLRNQASGERSEKLSSR